MRTLGANRRWIATASLLSATLTLSGCYFGPIAFAPGPTADSAPPTVSSPAPMPSEGSTATPRTTPVQSPQASARPTFIPTGPGDPALYLAALGAFPDDVVTDLARYVNAKYGIEVRKLAPSSLEPSAFDSARAQYVAEELLGQLVTAYPRADPNDGSVIIGLLTDDIYIRDRPDWNWAFGIRGAGGRAIVSTAHMGSMEDPIARIVMSRLRKMILRDLGVLYYGLPLNYDPISVLYTDVLSVDDLDRMGEELCGSDCPGRASAGRLTAAVPATLGPT